MRVLELAVRVVGDVGVPVRIRSHLAGREHDVLDLRERAREDRVGDLGLGESLDEQDEGDEEREVVSR